MQFHNVAPAFTLDLLPKYRAAGCPAIASIFDSCLAFRRVSTFFDCFIKKHICHRNCTLRNIILQRYYIWASVTSLNLF